MQLVLPTVRTKRLAARGGGLTSKLHVVVDANGLPVRLGLTPGEVHDNRLCSLLLRGLKPQTMLLADRAYDADWIRALIYEQGVWANIPPKRNRKDPICFSPYLYRARNLIERYFNKIKLATVEENERAIAAAIQTTYAQTQLHIFSYQTQELARLMAKVEWNLPRR
jgi:transposase